MSTRDRDRLKVLHEVQKRHISQKQAAIELGLSTRWVRKLLKRLVKQGDGGLVHGLRGRHSNRKLSEDKRKKVLAIFEKQVQKRQWHDYGPTLAAEELAADHKIQVSKETLRKWLIEAGLWKAKRARVERIHQWRARRERFGELVQWDTSIHDWLEGRGAKVSLIAMIDDATSRVVALFVEQDSTQANMQLLRSYLQTYGRPVAFYTDKASLFVSADKRPRDQPGQEVDPREMPPTQIHRALQELDIVWIAAHSPQAKGRVERFFGTAQNRLVKGLRKVRARTIEEANTYLTQVYLPEWNRRFAQPAHNSTDAHRSLDTRIDLDSVLSLIAQRKVAQDYTLRLQSRAYRIPRADIAPGMRGANVLIEQRFDQTLWLRWKALRIQLEQCPNLTRPSYSAPVPKPLADPVQARQRQIEGRNKFKENYDRKPNLDIWKAIRASNRSA